MAAGQNCPKSNCWYQKPMTKICNLMGLMCRSIKKLVDWETLGRTCNVQYVFFGRNWATWVHSILNVFFFLHSWMGTWTNILYTFTILNIFFRWGYFLRAKIGYQRILFFFAGYLSLFEVTFVIPRRSIPGNLWGIHFFGGGPFSKSNLKLMSRMIQSMQHDRAKQKCNEHGSQHVTLLETVIWLLIYPIIESA